jgi:hypothetical protein
VNLFIKNQKIKENVKNKRKTRKKNIIQINNKPIKIIKQKKNKKSGGNKKKEKKQTNIGIPSIHCVL